MAQTLSENEEVAPNSIDRKALQAFIDRLDNLHFTYDLSTSAFKADLKAVFAEAADTLKINRKMIRLAYNTRRSRLRQDEREASLDSGDRDQLDLVRSQLELFAES